MALTSISVGSAWSFKGTYGTGAGAIGPDVVLEVQDVVPPGTQGVGESATDTVLAMYDDGGNQRILSLSVEAFGVLCKKVAKNAR